VFLAHWN